MLLQIKILVSILIHFNKMYKKYKKIVIVVL